MAYKPFKMKGHSLPGPNQRKSPAKQKQATLTSVSDSLQNLPNPAADKAYQEYLERNKEISDSTNTAQQKVFEKRAKDIQQNVSPKEFEKQVKEVSSPAKQGYRSPDLRREKEANQRIYDNRTKKDNRKRKDLNINDKEPTRPPKKKSPTKQGLRDPRKDYSDPKVRAEEIRQNKAMIESRKKANPKSFEKDPWDVHPSDKNKPKRSKGGLKTLSPEEMSKRKKKSPAKCPLIAALPAITGAIGAVGASCEISILSK